MPLHAQEVPGWGSLAEEGKWTRRPHRGLPFPLRPGLLCDLVQTVSRPAPPLLHL